MEFDYSIPDQLSPCEGMRVLVDFRGRRELGIVIALARNTRIPHVKPLLGTLDATPSLTSAHIAFAKALCKRYPYSMGEFLFMMLPPHLKKVKSIDFDAGSDRAGLASSEALYVKGDSFPDRYRQWRHIAQDALTRGSVLVCFPQLQYLREAAKLIEGDFPQCKILHSYQSEKALFENWKNSRTRALIVGSRVALWYYPRDLELLVMEEENSPYYFQEEKPYHRALDIALELAKIKKNQIVLSGTYPTLDVYKRASDQEVSIRDIGHKEGSLKVVDVSGQKAYHTFNPVIIEILRTRIEQQKKIVMIWNKKGFGSSLTCTVCGNVLACSQCSANLRLTLDTNEGFCPYCSKRAPVAKVCPKCNSGYFKSSGSGIEKMVVTLRRFYPEVKIAPWEKRLPDTQIIFSTSKILSSLYMSERFDCGVLLDFDSSLNQMDYNAAFSSFVYARTLSLFFKEPLFVVTRNSGHYLFETLRAPWEDFYKKELALRREMHLPPFWSLAKFTLRGGKQEQVLEKAKQLHKSLESHGLEAYGPFEAQPFKLRGKYQYLLILKSKKSFTLRKLIKEAVKDIRSASIKVAVVIE